VSNYISPGMTKDQSETYDKIRAGILEETAIENMIAGANEYHGVSPLNSNSRTSQPAPVNRISQPLYKTVTGTPGAGAPLQRIEAPGAGAGAPAAQDNTAIIEAMLQGANEYLQCQGSDAEPGPGRGMMVQTGPGTPGAGQPVNRTGPQGRSAVQIGPAAPGGQVSAAQGRPAPGAQDDMIENMLAGANSFISVNEF